MSRPYIKELDSTKLLENVLKNYVIPKFQRPFVWNSDRILELVDSLSRDYLIGMIIIYEDQKTSLATENVEWQLDQDIKRVNYILDGQQRTRSLFLTLSLPEILEKHSIIKNHDRSEGKSPHIFTKRPTKHNRIKNRRGRWVDFDIFLDLNKLNEVEILKQNGKLQYFLPDNMWTNLSEIEKINLTDERSQINLLTEFNNNIHEGWYGITIAKKTKKDPEFKIIRTLNEPLSLENSSESNTQIDYISIHTLEIYWQLDIFKLFKNKITKNYDKLRYIFQNLSKNIFDSNIIVSYTAALEYKQLTHLFSRVNMSQVPLKSLDLLVAQTYDQNYIPKGQSKAIALNLRKTLDDIWDIYPQFKDFFGGSEIQTNNGYESLLTFLLLLKDVPKISKEGLLKINKDDLYKYELYENKIPSHSQSVHKIITPMLKAINLLDNQLMIKKVRDLRFRPILFVISAMFLKFRRELRKIPNFLEFLKYYVIFESFHNDAEIKNQPLSRYKSLISLVDEKNHMINLNYSKIFNRRPKINDIADSNLPLQNLKLLLYLKIPKFKKSVLLWSQTNIEIQNIRQKEVHHIFPVQFCKTRGIDKKTWDHVLNKTLISRETNNQIADEDPFTYRKRKDLKNLLDGEVLKSHLLPEKSWWDKKEKDFHKIIEQNNAEDLNKFLISFFEERIKLINKALQSFDFN